jgi:hypothetical protein
MADKERPSVEQRIKTVLFFIETRSVVVTQKQFHAHFQMRWAPSFKTIHKLYNQINNDCSVLERKRRRPSSCILPKTLTLSEWSCKEALVVGEWSPTGSTRHVGHQLAYCTCPGWLWGWRIWWNDDWQGKPNYLEKTCTCATLSTTNPTWPDRTWTRATMVGSQRLTAWAMARPKKPQ